MFGQTRAVFNLYGRRRPDQRPTQFAVDFDDRTRTEVVAVEDYPYTIQMPLLDPPGMLANRPPNPAEFPDLTRPGRLWTWRSPDATIKARALMQQHGARNIAPLQRIYLTEFVKVIAKIAHSYCIALRGYKEHARYFLQGLIRAPDRAVTNGSTYVVGAACYPNGARIIYPPTTEPYVLQAVPDIAPDGHAVHSVRVQLFAMLGAPVYEAIVYVWPPLLG